MKPIFGIKISYAVYMFRQIIEDIKADRRRKQLSTRIS